MKEKERVHPLLTIWRLEESGKGTKRMQMETRRQRQPENTTRKKIKGSEDATSQQGKDESQEKSKAQKAKRGKSRMTKGERKMGLNDTMDKPDTGVEAGDTSENCKKHIQGQSPRAANNQVDSKRRKKNANLSMKVTSKNRKIISRSTIELRALARNVESTIQRASLAVTFA